MASSSIKQFHQNVTKPTLLPRLSSEFKLAQTFKLDMSLFLKNNPKSIGQGGFGTVYICDNHLNNENVVLKKLTSSKFLYEELRVLCDLDSPHIVSVLGACYEESCLVLEYMPNGSLKDFLTICGPDSISFQKKLCILLEICLGLSYMHDKGYYHLDLKTANILLDQHLHAKLADFGLSVHQGDKKPRMIGTPGYRAPELFDEKYQPNVTHFSKYDIYSLGVVMLELFGVLNINKPNCGEIEKVPLKIFLLNNCKLKLSGLPLEMQQLIFNCISINLNARPTVVELAQSILKIFYAIPNIDRSLLPLTRGPQRFYLAPPTDENFYWLQHKLQAKVQRYVQPLKEAKVVMKNANPVLVSRGDSLSFAEIVALFSVTTPEIQEMILLAILQNTNLISVAKQFKHLSMYFLYRSSTTESFIKFLDITPDATTTTVDTKLLSISVDQKSEAKELLKAGCQYFVDRNLVESVKHYRFFKVQHIGNSMMKDSKKTPLQQSQLIEEYLHGPNLGFL